MRRRKSLSGAPLHLPIALQPSTQTSRVICVLRQRIELVQRPGLLVVDEAVEYELVAILIDVGRLLLGVIAVERKRARDRAFG